jgi:hypothetical protein
MATAYGCPGKGVGPTDSLPVTRSSEEKEVSISVEKFGKQKFAEVSGKRMAYIDEGALTPVHQYQPCIDTGLNHAILWTVLPEGACVCVVVFNRRKR